MECNRIEGAAVKHIANHLADVGRFLISPQLHRKCLPNSGEKGRAIPFFLSERVGIHHASLSHFDASR